MALCLDFEWFGPQISTRVEIWFGQALQKLTYEFLWKGSVFSEPSFLAAAVFVEVVVVAVVEAADAVGVAEVVVDVAAVVAAAAAAGFEQFQDRLELDASQCCLL